MSEGHDANAVLLARWREMGRHDQMAIIQALPVDRREQLHALLETSHDERNTAGRQFAGYSSWLASMVEAASHLGVQSGGGAARELKEPVRKAVAEAHAKLRAEGRPSEPIDGISNRLWDAVSGWMRRL